MYHFIDEHSQILKRSSSFVNYKFLVLQRLKLWQELEQLLNSSSIEIEDINKWRKIWTDWKLTTSRNTLDELDNNKSAEESSHLLIESLKESFIGLLKKKNNTMDICNQVLNDIDMKVEVYENCDKNKKLKTDKINESLISNINSPTEVTSMSNNLKKNENNIEEVQHFVKKAIFDITADALQKTMEKLIKLGVKKKCDIEFVERDDLSDILTPIEIRKLLKYFSHDSAIEQSTNSNLIQNNQMPNVPLPKPIQLLPNQNSVVFSPTKPSTIFVLGTNPSHQIKSLELLPSTPSSPQKKGRTFSTVETPEPVTPPVNDLKPCNLFPKPLNSMPKQNWADFEIPWNEFPKTVISPFEGKERPTKTHILRFIRLLCHKLNDIDPAPGRRNLRIVAQKLVAKFPQAFEDRCGTGVVAGGYITTLNRLEYGMDNMRRLKKSPFCDTPENLSHKRLRDSYGCVKWQPTTLPSEETTETQKKHKLFLKLEYPKGVRDTETVRELMKLTYCSQRYLINQKSTVISDISRDWPFLFEEEYLLEHAQILLGIDVSFVLQENLICQGKKIYEYMKSKFNKSSNEQIKLCLQEIDSMRNEHNHCFSEIIGVIPLLMKYFNDKLETLIHVNLDHVSAEDIILYKNTLPNTPVITTLGGSIFTANQFAVIIDRAAIILVDNFVSALKVLFASYYVFNIEYPESAAVTLEFIQRCFVGLNPPRGSKAPRRGNRRKDGVHYKILKFTNDMNDFESAMQL